MASPGTSPGRRERKKAATRRALADAALRLFLAHGYDNVTVREVAEAADVSATTLLKHFPSKEALVFDQDTDREDALVAAVIDRPADQSPVDALRVHLRARVMAVAGDATSDFLSLVFGTPALRDYWHMMWLRHESALLQALAAETHVPGDDPRCAALAHFALETSALALRADDPLRIVDAAFDLLAHGWEGAR